MEKSNFDIAISELVKENNMNISGRNKNSLFGTTIRDFKLYNSIDDNSKIVQESNSGFVMPERKGLLYFCSYQIFPIIREYMFNSSFSYTGPAYGYGATNYKIGYRENIYDKLFGEDYLWRPQVILFTEENKFLPVENSKFDSIQLLDSLKGFRDIIYLMDKMNAIESTIETMDAIHTKGSLYPKPESELIDLIKAVQRTYDRRTVKLLSEDIRKQMLKQVYYDNLNYTCEYDDEELFETRENKLQKILLNMKTLSWTIKLLQ